MAELNLQFTTTPSTDNGSFKLIELPPEICQLVDSAVRGERRLVREHLFYRPAMDSN